MKSQKRGSFGKTLENVRRFFCKIENLWFLASIFMLGIARGVILDE